MAFLTINGRPVTVPEGSTILEAAKELGIRIPTLCHVPGFPPSASCFMCAVQIEGRQSLAPSCAMPAADGQVVWTESDEVRSARKTALELLLSDHVGDCIGPCRSGCPARLDIPGFMSTVTGGDFRRSATIAADYLTLPASLGRICPRLCEQRCRRCDAGEPLSIAALHRFAADREMTEEKPHVPRCEAASGRRVAIVGAGPAGLTAAGQLLRRGHAVVLFDSHPEPGGMLRWGIPEFRLPRPVLDYEIGVVRTMGGEFRMSRRLGRDFSLADLRREYDAVLLAIGAQGSRGLGCDGEELALPAIDFLAQLGGGGRPQIGRRVLVVGGGNTAVDASRCAVRLGAESVALVYRRTRREMPCLMSEIEAAEAEGVCLETLVAPDRLDKAPDGTLRLSCIRMQLGEPDSSGRARPLPVPGSQFVLEADCVIAAIGQTVETRGLEGENVTLSSRGIVVDPTTLATRVDGVFAAGDGVTGPDLAVRAVAAGKLAAVSIDQYLGGRPVQGDPELMHVLMTRLGEDELAQLFREIEETPRAHMPELPVEERIRSFDEVELGLSAETAMGESTRCISCGCWKATTCQLRQWATEYGADPLRFAGARRKFRRDESHPEIVYEPGKCILCGACVVAASAAADGLGLAITGRGFDSTVAVPLRGTLVEALPTAARRAADVCPTGAFALRTPGSSCHFAA